MPWVCFKERLEASRVLPLIKGSLLAVLLEIGFMGKGKPIVEDEDRTLSNDTIHNAKYFTR